MSELGIGMLLEVLRPPFLEAERPLTVHRLDSFFRQGPRSGATTIAGTGAELRVQ